MSQAHDLTADAFEAVIRDNETVFIDFWAPWCGPCRTFKPVFEKAASKHPEGYFAKVNTEDQQQLAGAFGISSIPTLMAFREGVLVFSQPGALPPAALEELITKVGALDMAAVHAAVAKQQAQQQPPA